MISQCKLVCGNRYSYWCVDTTCHAHVKVATALLEGGDPHCAVALPPSARDKGHPGRKQTRPTTSYVFRSIPKMSPSAESHQQAPMLSLSALTDSRYSSHHHTPLETTCDLLSPQRAQRTFVGLKGMSHTSSLSLQGSLFVSLSLCPSLWLSVCLPTLPLRRLPRFLRFCARRTCVVLPPNSWGGSRAANGAVFSLSWLRVV